MTGVLAAAASGNGRPLRVTCSPASVAGVYDSELGTGITDATIATPTGGVAPYTVNWARVSGASFTITPNATSLSVSFQFAGASHQVAVYRVTATDHLGQTATADVAVTAN